MNASDFRNMTASERVQAMEILWNSLPSDEHDVASPGWHADILAERKAAIAEGKAKFISVKDLKASRRQ